MKAELRGLRVAFLAGTLGQGGAERQLYYMVRSLREHGAHPLVLSLTSGEYWEARIRELGVPVTCVGQQSTRWRRIHRIAGELAATRPHIIQSQHFFANLYAVLAGRLQGIPAIGAIRSDGTSEVASMWRPLGLLSLRAPLLVAANSMRGVQNAESLGARRDRIAFLPNVVDTEAFDIEQREDDGVVRLLCVGRLVRVKRVDRFLRLLAGVRQRTRVPVQGIIVGTGPEREALGALAAELGLGEPDLVFHGGTAELRSIYASGDALMLTSDWEGTPNVILEAMASRLPSVATDVGGVAAVLPNEKCGFVVDPDDELGLVEATLRIVEDAALRRRMGMAARDFIVKNHSVDRLADALAELYGRAVHGSGRGA